jgi:hypothetical protein
MGQLLQGWVKFDIAPGVFCIFQVNISIQLETFIFGERRIGDWPGFIVEWFVVLMELMILMMVGRIALPDR